MKLLSDSSRTNIKKIAFSSKDFHKVFTDDLNSFWTREGISVALDSEEQQLFDEAVDDIFSNKVIWENFSRSDIEGKIRSLLSRVGKVKTKSRKLVQEFVKLEKELTLPQEETNHYIQVSNLEIIGKKRVFSVGPIKFYKFTDYQAKKWRNRIKKSIKSPQMQKNLQDKSGKKLQEQFERHRIKPLLNSIVAEVTVKGTIKTSEQKALHLIRTSISIIKLYNIIRTDDSMRRYFGVTGDVKPPMIRTVLWDKDAGKSYGFGGSRSGFLDKFDVGGGIRWDFMKKSGFKKISSILSKKKKTNLDRRLLSSIYWYSSGFDVQIGEVDDKIISMRRGDKSPEYEYHNISDRFIKLMISLETLFTNLPSKNEPNKSQNLSERIAILIRKHPEDRQLIKKFVKGMYRIRGDIVHEGETLITREEVDKLMLISQEAILTLIVRKDRLKIKTDEDLFRWFEKQKFKG